MIKWGTFYNIVPPAVHTLLPSVLQCLDPTGKKNICSRYDDPPSRLWLYNMPTSPLKKKNTPTTKCSGITLHCIWWWGTRPVALRNEEYSFFAITTRSTMSHIVQLFTKDYNYWLISNTCNHLTVYKQMTSKFSF